MFKRLICALLAAALALTSPAVLAGACCSSFSIFPDTTRNFSSSVLLPPTYTDALVLTANVSQTQTIPSAATWVVFSADCNFYALPGASATVPAASTTNGSSAMQNPAAWNVTGTTQITVIAATSCKVTLSFYL